MKVHALLLLLSLCTGSISAQSNVQVINATSLDAVDFQIQEGRKYKDLRAGSRIAGGAFPWLDWHVAFHPAGHPDKERTAKAAFSLRALESRTIVLIGDAALVVEGDGKKSLRSRILALPHDLSPDEKPNRLIIVNGLPETPLTVGVSGDQGRILPPLESASFPGLPEGVFVKARATGISLDLPLRFLPPVRSAVICVYLREGKPASVVMEQRSLEGIQEGRTTPSSGHPDLSRD